MPSETAEEITAQDVVDALRFVGMSQRDPAEMVKVTVALLELAPETPDDRGVRLLINMICEGSLKVALTDA